MSADQEVPETYQPQEPNRNALEYAARQEEYEYRQSGFNVAAHQIGFSITQEDTPPAMGKDLVTMYYLAQISPHAGEELSGWELSSVFSALATKCLVNDWIRHNFTLVQNGTTEQLGKVVPANIDLGNALVKQGYQEFTGKKGYAQDLTKPELAELLKYRKSFSDVKARYESCGSAGMVMGKWVEAEKGLMEMEALEKSGRVLDEDQLNLLEAKIEGLKLDLDQARFDMTVEDMKMNSAEATTDTSKWGDILTAAIGVSQTMAVNREWLTNQSDLDPISKLWVYQGRMATINPSNLEALVKEYPSYNEAFRGIMALGSSKYALGANGKIYVSGRYGYGYVDAAGKLVDVDMAVHRDEDGKIDGVNPGFTKVGENQIWVPGKGLVDVVGGKAVIGGKKVEIFSRNFLRSEFVGDNPIRLKDRDTKEFLEIIQTFVKGKDKVSWDKDIELAVSMAREYFEFSMLANWNGATRDSKGNPYYMLDNDPTTLSSESDSAAVRGGVLAYGSGDEQTTYPYWTGGDWGKLTLTRFKQLSEGGKGRKHGLWALMPFLPESIVVPLLPGDQIDGKMKTAQDIIDGTVKIGDTFADMASMEHFKTYFLDIYKACALYDFISSNFIGDKDVTKTSDELIAFFGQTRMWEGLSKDIDLSHYWVDKSESARLRVNIVLAALATVAPDFVGEDFMGLTGKNNLGGHLEDNLITNKFVTNLNLEAQAKMSPIAVAFRQLVDSRFISGDTDDVRRILEHLASYKKGETPLGFTPDEFKATFGEDYLKRIKIGRMTRMDVVKARQAAADKKAAEKKAAADKKAAEKKK